MIILEYDKYYHVYNRGNNGEDLFVDGNDYNCFLRSLEKYLYPVADIYAWVLMKNHFHLLLRIKEETEITYYRLSNADRSVYAVRFDKEKWHTTRNLTASAGPVSVSEIKFKHPNSTLHISHFFNSYAKYFNKKYKRTGALFQRPFKRIEIDSNLYCRQLMVYIHTNPVHHGFTDDYTNYTWSSYKAILLKSPTYYKHMEVLEWFDNPDNFIFVHRQKVDDEFMKIIADDD
jgi:REP element-mobilizing transposase RayT